VSDGVGLGHREAFGGEKRADGERGDGDQYRRRSMAEVNIGKFRLRTPVSGMEA
jgi:hypothetical protein